jgi:hypothetical protein
MMIMRDELIKSWEETTAFLRDARAHLDQATEGICSDEIAQLEEYLEHNELGLALDMLDYIFEKSKLESWLVLELMAKAAASMNQVDRVVQYDARLSKARGWTYKTQLKREPHQAMHQRPLDGQ